jgi:hypothetical protein
MLKRGVTRINDPFHWPVLGTTASNGAGLRTVILRQFLLSERILVCYTDARAGKVDEITRFANVSWLFYHPKRKVQLRIAGKATLHGDDYFADEQWAIIKMPGRLNYCTTEPPGTPVDQPSSGLPDFLVNKVATIRDSERVRKNFMVIASRIDSMDWLRLSILGNRRARFDWVANELSAKWLVP